MRAPAPGTTGVAPKPSPLAGVHGPAAASAPGAVPFDQNGGQNGNQNGHDLIDLDTDKMDSGKSAQSYLALTKLGMGKKEPGESPKDSKKSEKPTSNTTNGNTKDGKQRKTMAEMASSTLKGFTKM